MSTLTAVRGVADEVADRATEVEARRSVPDDLVRRIGATGAFRLFVPRALGGAEVDPVTACEVVEELSRADGSTGWTSMILNTTFFSCWLDDDVVREMLDTDPELGMAGMFSPIGRAEPAGDGTVRLTGRWPFNSGSPHATWFCEGAMLLADGAPPAWKFVFVPASDVEIIDTWHVAGLRGTASHDVAVEGAVVPESRIASPIFDPAPRPEAHFRWNFFTLLAPLIAGVPLGVARRSLDEFGALARQKARGGAAQPLATEQVVQLEVARCEGALRAARSFLHDALGSAWATAVEGDPPRREQRLDIHLAASHAMRAAIDVVDTTFALAGGSAIYDHHPLQRCWRDLHAASSHLFFSNSYAVRGGQVLLDQPADEWLL